jgi:hypothetical protein
MSTSSEAPPVTLNIASLAASIAATPDPGAFVAQLVSAVAAHSVDAAHQGRMLSTIKSMCDNTLKLVRTALLGFVGEQPGSYDGFVIYERDGSRTVDYDKLRAEYPDAYAELVRVGKPTLVIKYVS